MAWIFSIYPPVPRQNIDISTGVMFKEGPLIQLCLEYLDDRNPGPKDPKRLSPAKLHDRDRISLQRFLTNLRVSTSHGGRTQTRPIQKLTTQGANTGMFTLRQEENISVADYFRTDSELNTPLRYPEVICVEVGSWCWKVKHTLIWYLCSSDLGPKSHWSCAPSRAGSSCSHRVF